MYGRSLKGAANMLSDEIQNPQRSLYSQNKGGRFSKAK
jgi:hypothetical protein